MLILAATPIGDVADASAHLVELLGTADVVAAEDTRRVRRLAHDLGVQIPGRVVSYFDGNEERRTVELLQALRDGETVVVATDAGMPSVSDPGYRLVVAAVEAGIDVTSAPGPSAVLAALAVSGLAVDRFCFEGFPPRKPGERARRFAAIAPEERTMVFFESPHRTAATLQAMADAWGADRRAVVCRELTKTHEEVRRGSLGDLAGWADEEPGVRGEVTIVVAGAQPVQYSGEDAARMVAEHERSGMSRRDAIAAVTAATGLSKRAVFDAVHHRPEGSHPVG